MLDIPLIDGLHIKKLDAMDQKDIWLANELDKDEMISGEDGYLYPINSIFKDRHYLNGKHLLRSDIYQSPYAIYCDKVPVGFMEISDITFTNMVEVTYALLKQYRGKGYAFKTLKEVSRQILLDQLNDVQSVSLVIDLKNEASQNVAMRAGFVSDGLSEEEHNRQGYIGYQKTKTMLLRENKFN